MKLWKKKLKEFDEDLEQSEEFEQDEEIEDVEESKIRKSGKGRKALEKLGGAGRKIGGFIKKHKILTVLLVLILIAAIVAGVIWQNKSKRPQMQAQAIETAKIEKMDLTNSVSVTGTLATANGKTGSTTLKDIKATNVYVKVGDEVQEGDIICTFDSSDIEKSLADAKNNYSVNQQLDSLDNYETTYQDTISDAEDSLQDARDTRDAYKNAYNNAKDAEQTALDNLNKVKAQYDTESLKKAYEEAASALKKAIQDADTNENKVTITDLESYLSSVNGALPDSCNTAYETYKDAKSAYESAEKAISDAQSAYEQAQNTTSQAYSSYEQAQSEKEKVQDQYDSTVKEATKTYEKAKLQDQLVTDDDAKSKIEDYEEQLSDCTVYASMSGTITTLNVEEDNVFSGGTIYEIQDVHNFIVEATVDEYDVVKLAVGQTAYVKTDSLGDDEELEGEVTYVAPTGTSGQTMGSSSGTASYEIQITLKESQDQLKAGMTASVSIALEESKDTLAVPYDCVQTNANGDSVIYVDDNGEKKEVKVETGIETDYYTEVKSDEISEGMTVYLSTPLQQSTGDSQTESIDSQDAVIFDMGGSGGGTGGGPGGGGGTPGGGGGAPGGF